MGTTRIASVHWFEVTAKRRYRGESYVIPAAELNGAPRTLETRDLFQNEEGPTMPGTNKRQKLQYLVTGEEIAHCIVGEWTGTTVVGLGMNPDRHPGIWIVRDRIPVIEQGQKIVDGVKLTYEEKMVLDAAGSQVFRPATEAEFKEMWDADLAHARAADRAYAEWCWGEGNRIHRAWQQGSKEPVPREMPPLYKAAARHYGLDAEWLKEAASSNMKQCEHCDHMIRKDAMLCGNCHQPNDLQKWAAWTAQKEAALLDAQTLPNMPPPTAAGKHGISNRPQAVA